MTHAALKRGAIDLATAIDDGTPFAMRFWDTEEQRFGAPDRPPAFTIRFTTPAALRHCFGNPSLGFGEGYMEGTITVDGALAELLRLVNQTHGRARMRRRSLRALLRFALLHASQRNSLRGAAENIHRHYDHGNEFYRLWLDQRMVYSCAYFRNDADSLDRAQEQKLEYLCRKLELRAGERVLDIGCGWGSFAMYAAERYGARVTGITLSDPQLEEGRRRVAAAGLGDRVELLRADYRAFIATAFDRVISIGMFEHVGRERMRGYFDAVDRLLVPGGVAVLHTIGRMDHTVGDPWIHRYIFPGHYTPYLGELCDGIARTGHTVTDVENLRLHYARTLEHWLANFTAHREDVRRLGFDDRFMRMWQLYLATVGSAFRHGTACLWQIVSTKGTRNDLPATREHWYAG